MAIQKIKSFKDSLPSNRLKVIPEQPSIDYVKAYRCFESACASEKTHEFQHYLKLATEFVQSAINAAPNFVEAYQLAAGIAITVDNTKQAKHFLKVAKGIDPGNPHTLFLQKKYISKKGQTKATSKTKSRRESKSIKPKKEVIKDMKAFEIISFDD